MVNILCTIGMASTRSARTSLPPRMVIFKQATERVVVG